MGSKNGSSNPVPWTVEHGPMHLELFTLTCCFSNEYSKRCDMSKIEKERFVVRDRAFDHGDGFVGDDIGEIEIVR